MFGNKSKYEPVTHPPILAEISSSIKIDKLRQRPASTTEY